MSIAPLAPRARQQDKSGATRNCDSRVNRRQLVGQPMTDYMKTCQANEVNPENLGKICNNAADDRHLSGTARQTYLAECTKVPTDPDGLLARDDAVLTRSE